MKFDRLTSVDPSSGAYHAAKKRHGSPSHHKPITFTGDKARAVNTRRLEALSYSTQR